MEAALGPRYVRTWAREHVIAGLEQRTVMQALEAGVDAKSVWRAVWEELELPARDR
jgi:thiamine monophosphate synthase